MDLLPCRRSRVRVSSAASKYLQIATFAVADPLAELCGAAEGRGFEPRRLDSGISLEMRPFSALHDRVVLRGEEHFVDRIQIRYGNPGASDAGRGAPQPARNPGAAGHGPEGPGVSEWGFGLPPSFQHLRMPLTSHQSCSCGVPRRRPGRRRSRRPCLRPARVLGGGPRSVHVLGVVLDPADERCQAPILGCAARHPEQGEARACGDAALGNDRRRRRAPDLRSRSRPSRRAGGRGSTSRGRCRRVGVKTRLITGLRRRDRAGLRLMAHLRSVSVAPMARAEILTESRRSR
jgi:hypothetical protein